jgi:hypothetical protein
MLAVSFGFFVALVVAVSIAAAMIAITVFLLTRTLPERRRREPDDL